MRQSGNVSGKPRAGDGSPLDSLPEEPESLGKRSCVNHQCTSGYIYYLGIQAELKALG